MKRKREAPQRAVDLASYARTVAAGACLAAVTVVPGYFNLHSERAFDEDRILLLQSLALVAFAAVSAAVLVDRARRRWWVAVWQTPLFVPVAAFVAATLAATAFSVAPHASFFGTSLQRQGAYALLSDVAIMATVVFASREPAFAHRLVSAMLAGSVLPAFYACLQALGLELLPFPAGERVSSTAGNPVFLAAYLIMVWPLTLARLGAERERIGAVFGYGALLACQTIAILATRSRGASIALIVGAVALGVMMLAEFVGRRRVRMILGVALSTAMLALAAVATPLLPRGVTSPIAATFDPRHGSGRVRALVWKGVLDLVAAHPRRAILGWGPETMGLVFEPYQDPEITHLEHRYQRAGRAHNIVFDSFVSIGVVGAIALVAVWISVFSHLFQSMGLAATRTDAAIFVGVVVAASVAGALIAVKSAGVIWVALGGGAGFIGGLLLYAMWAAQRETTPPPNHGGADRLTLAAIAAALVAHIVEVQFSFETVSSALLFWADIGLAVAIGGRSAVQTLASDVGRDAPVVLPRPGLVTAFVLFVFIFDFCSVPGLLTTREGPAVALFVGVWLMATWIDVGAASFLTHAATLLALAALLFVALTGSIDARVAYGLLFALVAVGAAHRVPRAQARGHLDAWRPTMAALLAAFAAYGVVGNVKRSRAGTLAKLGKEYASRLQWEAAAPLLQEAARSEPDEGRHFADLGSMLVAQAQSVGGAAAQAQLQQAVAHVEHARVLQPAEVDHPATLAEFQATWATMSTTTAERDQHWDAAARLYAQTAAARPSHPGVWARWALLDRDRGRLDAAHAKLTKAIALDGESADLYLVRADVEIRARKYADALADFERAERLAPLTPDQARAKAILLERLR